MILLFFGIGYFLGGILVLCLFERRTGSIEYPTTPDMMRITKAMYENGIR